MKELGVTLLKHSYQLGASWAATHAMDGGILTGSYLGTDDGIAGLNKRALNASLDQRRWLRWRSGCSSPKAASQ